jgi:hypothetical protein
MATTVATVKIRIIGYKRSMLLKALATLLGIKITFDIEEQ